MSAKWKPQTLGQYHDSWTMVLSAPDRFFDVRTMSLASDQKQAMRDAFNELRDGFHFVEKKLKNERLATIAREMIEMSFEAYSNGDSKKGAHTIQECEGLIWPKHRLRVKYAVEAERRVFGSNVTFADVIISPFPYEGTSADLGEDQAQLLELAKLYSRSYQLSGKEFKSFSWVIDHGGEIRRTSAQPQEDTHPTLGPLQRSWGYKRLKELGENAEIRACVLVEIVGPLGDGVVTYDLEQNSRPRVSARQLFKRVAGKIVYEEMRYHLQDPQFFPDPPAKS